MRKVKRAYVDHQCGQLHYRYCGEPTNPAIVMIHESPVSGKVYEAAMPFLADRYFVLATDTPGYGASDAPEKPLEIPGYASLILNGLRNLGLSRWSLVGAHTGAAIAVEMAVQAPEALEKMVIMGLTLYTEEERQHLLATWTPPFAPKADGSHLQWVWDRYQGIWGADSAPEILETAAVEFLKAGERYHWAYQAAFRYDPADAIKTIKQNVLYLVAEHDLLANVNDQAVALTRNSSARVIPGFAGQLPLRTPKLFADIVTDFLSKPK